MTTDERRPPCEVGPDDTRLLAYLEGALSDEKAHEIDAHLQVCPACTKELELLQRMISLMETHSTAFHIDEAALYRFVVHREDPQGTVAQHLSACEDCRADVDALREMLQIDAATTPVVGPMPESLRARLEALQAAEKVHEERVPWFARLRDKLGELFGPVPTLAFGTAAALVILAVLLVPLWPKIEELTQQTARVGKTQKEEQVPLADTKLEEAAPSAPAEQPQEYRHEVPAPSLEKDSLLEEPETTSPASAVRPLKRQRVIAPYLGGTGRVSEGKGAPTPAAPRAAPSAQTLTKAPPPLMKMKRAETSRKGDIEPEKEVVTAGIRHFRSKQGDLVSVRVRVVDAHGRDIPRLAAQISGRGEDEVLRALPLPLPPPPMPKRKEAARQDRRERDGASVAEEWKEQPLVPAHEIVIRVDQVGEEYRITGSLQDTRTGTVLHRLERSNIALSSLGTAVDSMITALTEDPGSDPSQK
ncbi:MAG: zf-HC2 domain-containing protein [Thermodesulfobacteriota bacterium]